MIGTIRALSAWESLGVLAEIWWRDMEAWLGRLGGLDVVKGGLQELNLLRDARDVVQTLIGLQVGVHIHPDPMVGDIAIGVHNCHTQTNLLGSEHIQSIKERPNGHLLLAGEFLIDRRSLFDHVADRFSAFSFLSQDVTIDQLGPHQTIDSIFSADFIPQRLEYLLDLLWSILIRKPDDSDFSFLLVHFLELLNGLQDHGSCPSKHPEDVFEVQQCVFASLSELLQCVLVFLT